MRSWESQEVDKKEDLAGVRNNWASNSSEPSKDLGSVGEMKLQKRGFEVPNFFDESSIDVVVDERDDKDDVVVGKNDVLMGRGENFGIFDTEEVDTGIRDLDSQPIIPGLSIPGVSDAVNYQGGGNFGTCNEASAEGDDWDSDSEDDLQIVLNDNNHGPMTMDRAGLVGSDDDDEDEDGDTLIIVADTDPNHQPMEEQEWSNDFKYVRPGAASMPGAAPTVPGGTPGQVRPTVNMAIAGRGRGDLRSTGMKNASPMQKSFHPGFGMPVPLWGNNASGRAFGSGLDFTLPSYKTIFDVEVDSFEEKPWRLLGVDISDFFNFSLNEESWKDYCKQLEQLRLEATMQSRIRVYEGGRTEQEYDPDLPPELAAAAGIREVSSGNGNTVKTDAGQSDFAKSSTRVRPPLPTGRAIQVESGYGERLPSIDTRPPRFRDSDAIIEIVLQDSTDDDSFPGNDVVEQPENDPSSEDLRGGHEIEEDIAQDETEHFDGIQHAYKGGKRELVGRDNTSEGDGILPFPPEAPSQYHPVSQGQTPLYPGRNFGTPYESQAKGRAHDRSPNMTPSEGTQDKRFLDNLKEELVESIVGEHSPLLSSPVSAGGIAVEPVVELGDDIHDELVLADGSSGMEREEMALTNTTSTLEDEIMNAFCEKTKTKFSS
ncbi:hypothetical protein F0562_009312 [Nyssa sinensis]|uniref:Pre-mRNA polyadenylation factor Fip1 domain-containing protein n=1 Tax=Nyssa sinensis TaxID=561372 RepID=A0A5J4ZXU4_9ASTE|nr:hypothetical protein F0562_009312 [Nyssa sinensis]